MGLMVSREAADGGGQFDFFRRYRGLGRTDVRTYVAARKPASCRMQIAMRFQLALVWSTILRS
jgi:hypothetical protein